MKRLTSILLALLMLVGMALAEETPDDAVLGNWYGLNAQTIIRLTLKEDGEFKLVVGYLSYTGSWQQTAESEYRLESPDMATDILLRETETGLELRYETIDDMLVLLARSLDAWADACRTHGHAAGSISRRMVGGIRPQRLDIDELGNGRKRRAAAVLHGVGDGHHPVYDNRRGGSHLSGDAERRRPQHDDAREGADAHCRTLPDGGGRHVCHIQRQHRGHVQYTGA